jgi:SPP1 gp7 family putative phage head morphogenesis protein
LIDTIAKQLQEGKMKPEDLNIELIKQTYKDLSSGAKEGFGKSWETQYTKKGEDTVVTELKKNLYTFAGAKSYAMLETVNKMLYSQDGKMRPFNEYSQLVRKVNAQYNKHWLQAEYQTARAAAQMANKWQKIQAEKELFPNLRYRTTGDGKVRDEHVMLNGIVKPVDDPFWGIYYPPNGWRCRCDVVQTAEKVTQDKIADLDVPDMPGNVGIDEEIFTNNHKFFKLLKTNDRAVRNSELMKLNAPLENAYSNKGKSVKVNIFYDKKDFAENLESAKIIVDELKMNVEIRGHINLDKYKNPEYFINGKLADLKKIEKITGISNGIKSAKNQLGNTNNHYSIVFNLDNIKNIKITDITAQLDNKFSAERGKKIDSLIFVKGNKAIELSRKSILDKEFSSLEAIL